MRKRTAPGLVGNGKADDGREVAPRCRNPIAGVASAVGGVIDRSGMRRITFRASLFLGLMMLSVVAILLASARRQAWEKAEQQTANVKQSVIGEIRSQLDLYSTMLDIAAGLIGGPASSRASRDATLLALSRMVRDL